MGSKGCVNRSVLPRSETGTELSGEHSETVLQFLMTLLLVKLMFAGTVCSSFLYER